MELIASQKPNLDIQATSLSSIPKQLRYYKNPTIFIHHAENQHHFITSSLIGGTIRTFDSLNLSLSPEISKQMAAIYTPDHNESHRKMRLARHNSVKYKQTGSTDCGVFEITYTVELVLGTDPGVVYEILFKQKNSSMHKHLIKAFESGRITHFPREGEAEPAIRPKLLPHSLQYVPSLAPAIAAVGPSRPMDPAPAPHLSPDANMNNTIVQAHTLISFRDLTQA